MPTCTHAVRAFLAGLIACVALAGPAAGAEPESGTLSAESPTVSWTGEAETAPLTPWMRDDERLRLCLPAVCDRFELEVASAGDLVIRVRGDARPAAVRVSKPDGSSVFGHNLDADAEQPVVIEVPAAALGSYAVEIWIDATEAQVHTYAGAAELRPPAPTPLAAPAPAAQPAAPSASPPVTLRIHRARAGRRRLAVTLESSDRVTDVRLQVVGRSRFLASAAVAQLQGRQTINVRLRRPLRAGRYVIALTAATPGGQVRASAPLRIRR